MRRTAVGDLIIAFLLVGAAVYLVLQVSYGSMPPLQYYVPVPIAALAVIEFVIARRVRAAVRHHPNARPMAAIVIARCVALGKASALVAAAVIGAVAGLLLRVAPDAGRVQAAGNDLRVGIAVLIAAGLLLAAALLLERAGIDPNRDRDPPGAMRSR